MSSRVRRRSLRGALLASLVAAISLLAGASAQASTLPTLTVNVTKSSITVAGAMQSGAVNVVATASGVKEATAILFLLKPGVSVSQAESFLAEKGAANDPNNTSKLGAIVVDEEASSKKASEAQAYLQPGQYMALVPGERGGSKAHSFFTVTASASPAALPAPGATIRTIEFGFRGPSTLHQGEVVRFENEGFVVHMDLVFPVKSQRAAKQAMKDLLAGKEKALGKLVAGEPFGVGPLSHEAFQQMTITAKPGWYVQACFMETQDGRDHTRIGMERILKIVK